MSTENSNEMTNLEKAAYQYISVAKKFAEWYSLEIEIMLEEFEGRPAYSVNLIGEYPMHVISDFYTKMEIYKEKLKERWNVEI